LGTAPLDVSVIVLILLFEESVFLPSVKANRAGGYKPATSDFIDGKTYDGKKPNDYIDSFKIGLK